MLADLALLLSSAYHVLGALYYLGASKRKREKEFEFVDLAVHIPAKSEDPKMLARTVRKVKEVLNPKQIILVVDPESLEAVKREVGDLALILTGAEKGKAHALNVALQYTEAKYVMVLDADSYPEEGYALRTNPYTASLWRGYASIKNKWSEAFAPFTTLASIGIIYGRDLLGLKVIPPGSGVMIEKDLLEDLGGWDEGALTEDIELALRALEKGIRAKSSDSFVYVEVPPGYFELKKQQARWAYGAVQAMLKHLKALDPELFMYLTQYSMLWLPLIALILSPLGLSPISLLIYYSSVAFQAIASNRAAKIWKVNMSLKKSARVSASGLAMSIDILISMVKATLGRPFKWVVTPKGGKRLKGRLSTEYLLLLTPLISILNPISLPLALQYFASSLFVIKEVRSE